VARWCAGRYSGALPGAEAQTSSSDIDEHETKSSQRRGALAIMGGKRAPGFPNVPTMVEAGLANQESVFMQGILFPAGTPKAIIDQWYGEVARIAAMPEIEGRLLTLGLEPVVNTPEEFGAQIKMETARWTKVIREAGIRATE
jgi:tripartite-type tricarboxylate transporter receptor subunit TctC